MGLHFTLSSAVSRSLTGCFAQQNIGEVARSDGGVNTYNQNFILSFQPLSSETTVPLVSPLLSATGEKVE